MDGCDMLGAEGKRQQGERLNTFSRVTGQELILRQRPVPTWLHVNASSHRAEPDSAALRGCGGELGNGFTFARDDDLFAVFEGADELGKAAFGFSDTHVHTLRL